MAERLINTGSESSLLPSPTLWADLVDAELAEEDLDVFDDDERASVFLHDHFTCCRSPVARLTDVCNLNVESILVTIYCMFTDLDISQSIGCLANEINNCISILCYCICNNVGEKSLHLACADSFLRSRHEVLHALSISAVGLPPHETDMKFSDLFPISSNRTPDMIYKNDYDNSVLIIETTVSTDKGKSYQMKGKESEGFQSKYEVEISQIRELGFSVDYFVLHFDSKDLYNFEYRQELENIANLLGTTAKTESIEKLEILRRCYCNIQHIYSKYIGPLNSLLFVDTFEPDYYPSVLYNLLSCDKRLEIVNYQRIAVSNQTYSRIQTSWPRLQRMLEMSDPDFYNLTLDLVTNKLSFVKSASGLHFDDWTKILVMQDKSTLFLNLKMSVAGVVTTESHGKIEYFFKRGDAQVVDENSSFQLTLHDNTSIVIMCRPVPDYSHYIKSNEFINMGVKTERVNIDEKLEELLTPLFRLDTEEAYFSEVLKFNKKPFCATISGEVEFKKAVELFEKNYSSINSLNDEPRNVQHQKPSFLYPLINPNAGFYMSYKSKNLPLITGLQSCILGPYTTIILAKIAEDKFQFGGKPVPPPPGVLLLENQLSDNQRSINKIQMLNRVNNMIVKASSIPECSELIEQQRVIRRNLKAECAKTGYKKNLISLIRLPTRNKKRISSLGQKFVQEMAHFKGKGETSIYKGVGRFDYDILSNEFEHLKNAMLGPSKFKSPDPLYDDFVADDAKLLKKLKEEVLTNHRSFFEQLSNTSIYGTCSMICRLCYTLNFFSQTSIGGDYIMCDNLGYSKTLLIMKGGKKLFKTKKSKLFKIFFPTYQAAQPHYYRRGYSSNFNIHKLHDGDIIESPWMMLDEQLLVDGLTFLSRNMGFVLINKGITTDFGQVLSVCYFNVLLSIHGRRQTEEFLHNIRYLTVNCISECSSVSKMLPTLAAFNYDFFQCFLKESIIKNFLSVATSLKVLHDKLGKDQPDSFLEQNPVPHMFDKQVEISSTDQLTLMIYCTFLMTKAPVTQGLEQLRNLKNMIETKLYYSENCHDGFSEKYELDMSDLTTKSSLNEYWDDLFCNDFKYDPGYVNQLGKFCGDYLSNFLTKSEVNSKWESLLGQPWDLFANTKGLRGKRGEKDFFGKKGYFIVYKEVLRDPEVLNKVYEVLLSEEDDFTKRKRLAKINQDFKSKLNDTPLEYCIFHVVDKRQRGGSREIFCMDLYTKIHQQPIEKLAGFLCKSIPNELISIPSNKRVFHIHSNVHERFLNIQGHVYNLSFDCRRWAPHSTFTKFIDFLLGMRDFLPRSFLVHTLAFFEKMNTKRVYTKSYVEKMLKNSQSVSEKMKNTLIFDETVDAPYLEMPYSWMMGIFNYLSSLLHVANQLHISHIVNNLSVRNLNEEVNVHMTAHSDDSGGKLLCGSRLTMFKVITTYELLLKSSNHMLSDKKCNISLVYFELLSILYFGDRLMSLLPKFAGSFNFHPSDGGYATDIGEAYSKCIELLMVGATFEQAYMAFKIQTMLIWRFYFGKTVDKIYYCYPPQILGMPDAHPLSILISGTDSDSIRLYLFSNKVQFVDFLKISKFFIGFDSLEDSFITPLKATPRIITGNELKKVINLTDSKISEGLSWVLNNLSIKNTAVQLLSYIEKLKDKKFVAALQDETIERRLSRAFYYRNAQCLSTKNGQLSYSQFRELLGLHYIIKNELEPPAEKNWTKEVTELFGQLDECEDSFKNGMRYFELLHSEIITLNRSMDSRTYDAEMLVESNKTCKPVHINIQRISAPLSTDYKPDLLTTWIKFPECRWLLPPSSYQHNECMLSDFLRDKSCSLELCEPNWLHKLLRKYKDKYLKEFYMYSNMPSSSRDINNYKDILMFLAHNSFHNKYINGIVSPYNRLMNVTFTQIFEDLIDGDMTDAINLLDFITGAINDNKMRSLVDVCQINHTTKKGIPGLMETIDRLISKKKGHFYLLNLITPHFKCLIGMLEDNTFKSEWISKSYFHCFTKKQHLVGNVWVGKGKLYINTPTFNTLLEIENQKIVSSTVNTKDISLSKYDLAYIDYVLTIGQLSGLKNHLIEVDTKDWNMLGFGLNQQGEFGVCIKRFLVASIPKVHLSKQPHPILSNLSLCNLQVLPRLKYKVTKSFADTEDSLIVHTFDMPVENILTTLNKSLNNEHNVLAAAQLGREYKDYIDYIVGTVSKSDLYLSFNDLYENYNISQVYAILYECKKLDIVNFSKLKLRNKYYPAQEGGLLNLLIEYKKIKKEFLFNPDLVLTPELAYLKATQPESFMSNLITNIKERYDSLYTDIDKSLIMKRMHKLLLNTDDENFESSVIETLSTWGYTGVMGAIGELTFEKNFEIFKSLEYPPSPSNLQNADRLLMGFNDSFYNSFKLSGVGFRLVNHGLDKNLGEEGFTELFRSFLFLQCLCCYGKVYVYNCQQLTASWVWFNNLFFACLQDEPFISIFNERITAIIGWSNAPVEASAFEIWIIAYQTLVNIVNTKLQQKTELNVNKQFHRMGDDILNFKTIMGSYTSIDKLLEVRKLSYMGTISTFLHNELCTKTVQLANNNYRISPVFKGLSKILVPFSSKYIFPGVLSEDFLDEDAFEEIKCELLSNDPDMDSVEDYLSQVDEKFVVDDEVFCYVRKSNKLAKCRSVDLSIINLVGTAARPNDLHKVRMQGNNLMIISEVLYPQLINEMEDKVGVYKRTTDKRSKALVSEEHILFYLITSDPRAVFAKAYGLQEIDKKLLSREFIIQTYAKYYLPSGQLYDKKVILDSETEVELMTLQAETLKRRREMKVNEVVEDVEEIELDVLEEYSKKHGISVELIKKHLKKVDAKVGLFDVDLIEHAIALVKSGNKLDSSRMAIKNVVEKPHDAKTIERIFEVPEVFQTGRSVVSDLKNRSLKEPRLRAELESLAPNITNLILSNRLTISHAKLKKMKTNMTLWKSYLTQTHQNKRNKKFLIDMITLVTNDANISNDTKNDHIWNNIVDKISDKIVEDEDSETEDIAYEIAPHSGFLNYKPK